MSSQPTSFGALEDGCTKLQKAERYLLTKKALARCVAKLSCTKPAPMSSNCPCTAVMSMWILRHYGLGGRSRLCVGYLSTPMADGRYSQPVPHLWIETKDVFASEDSPEEMHLPLITDLTYTGPGRAMVILGQALSAEDKLVPVSTYRHAVDGPPPGTTVLHEIRLPNGSTVPLMSLEKLAKVDPDTYVLDPRCPARIRSYMEQTFKESINDNDDD